MSGRFELGQVLWADLPQRVPHGHEQAGRRPVIVVALPDQIQRVPYRMPIVVPVTRTRFTGPLFPVLAPGAGGLPDESSALVHQVLAIDESRLIGRLGRLTPQEYRPIHQALQLMFSKTV